MDWIKSGEEGVNNKGRNDKALGLSNRLGNAAIYWDMKD